MDDLLPIGRFARLAGLSVGALRHYDELDLLRPAETDEFTGYRRYRTSQLEDARTIARLRELEVPLEEIRDVLATDDPAERARRLDAHRARIEARTHRLQRVLHHVRGVVERKEPIVSKPPGPPELDQATRRALAAGLFNHTWTLLETEPAHARPGRRDDPLARTPRATTGARSATTCTSPAGSGSAPACTRCSVGLSPRSGTPAAVSSSPRRTRTARTGTCPRPTRRWPARATSRATPPERPSGRRRRSKPWGDRRPRGPDDHRGGHREPAVTSRTPRLRGLPHGTSEAPTP